MGPHEHTESWIPGNVSVILVVCLSEENTLPKKKKKIKNFSQFNPVNIITNVLGDKKNLQVMFDPRLMKSSPASAFLTSSPTDNYLHTHSYQCVLLHCICLFFFHCLNG